MGTTGAGKSSVCWFSFLIFYKLTYEKKFINFLLGEERVKVGHGMDSCSAHVEAVVIEPGDRFPGLNNYRVIILDTPGFDDTSLGSDTKILQRIADWVATA